MKRITKAATVSLLTLAIGLALTGCGSYEGRYTDGNPKGKFIDVTSDEVSIADDVDGTLVSNSGKITGTTKSSDGKTITLKGDLDYSGGSGTAFGVTVKPGDERHWTTPFTATINTAEQTITFQGKLIVDSLTTRPWDVTLKKAQ